MGGWKITEVPLYALHFLLFLLHLVFIMHLERALYWGFNAYCSKYVFTGIITTSKNVWPVPTLSNSNFLFY